MRTLKMFDFAQSFCAAAPSNQFPKWIFSCHHPLKTFAFRVSMCCIFTVRSYYPTPLIRSPVNDRRWTNLMSENGMYLYFAKTYDLPCLASWTCWRICYREPRLLLLTPKKLNSAWLLHCGILTLLLEPDSGYSNLRYVFGSYNLYYWPTLTTYGEARLIREVWSGGPGFVVQTINMNVRLRNLSLPIHQSNQSEELRSWSLLYQAY